MLIEQDHVPVRLDERQAGGAGRRFVGFRRQGEPVRLELLLQIADVGKRLRMLAVTGPTGVERHEVALEHALKQADGGLAVAKDEPVLLRFPADHGKAETLVKGAG
jgi:hypothetical protein